jgi:hypothetical protein
VRVDRYGTADGEDTVDWRRHGAGQVLRSLGSRGGSGGDGVVWRAGLLLNRRHNTGLGVAILVVWDFGVGGLRWFSHGEVAESLRGAWSGW